MWIPRKAFDTLNEERIRATEEARVLSAQNIAIHNTLNWITVRLEQVERERAHLLKTYMGVVVAVPTFVKPEPSQDDVLSGTNIFNDVGDEEAKRLNRTWDGEGRIS